MIKTFDSFANPPKKRSDSAGVAIVLESEPKKILLVHPTNGSWRKPVLGIPKGKIEEGEDHTTAALRELFEETGIMLDASQVEPGIHTAEVWKGESFNHNIHYLICRISKTSDIGLVDERVPKSQVQAGEIDWAGFVSIDDAYSKIASSQRIILDRLR